MSSGHGSGPNFNAEVPGPWQLRLEAYCSSNGLRPPIWHTASDRRGGRTAWSRSVEVNGQVFAARFWWDGNYIQSANEDAAEVALMHFESQRLLMQQQQQYQDQQQQYNSSQDAQNQNAESSSQPGDSNGWPGPSTSR